MDATSFSSINSAMVEGRWREVGVLEMLRSYSFYSSLSGAER
jgi:hypothetical protein